MRYRKTLFEIDATLRSKGFIDDGIGVATYHGTIPVHGNMVDVTVDISDVTFNTLPRVYLNERSQIKYPALAHLDATIGICYTNTGLPLDLYNPGASILRVLAEVQSTLELSAGGRGANEIIAEYASYWRTDALPIRSFVRNNTDKVVSANFVSVLRNNVFQFYALTTEADLVGYEIQTSTPTRIYNTGKDLEPVAGILSPNNLFDLARWFREQKGLKLKWDECLFYLADSKTIFIKASNAVIGFALEVPPPLKQAVKTRAIRKIKMPTILMSQANKIAVNRLLLEQCDIETVTARNINGVPNLANKRVALVGCGTIGSHLAKMLAQSGAGTRKTFILIDKELLSTGNLGRHLLGMEHLGLPKAEGVAAELIRMHPQTKVKPLCGDAVGFWDEISRADLIIDATGEWNAQTVLNDLFLNGDRSRPQALLHSWVNLNGVSVQSFLNMRDKYACFRCLKGDIDGPWRFPTVQPTADLTIIPASCGDSAYVPFSVDAAISAAALTNKAALDWSAETPGFRLRSEIINYEEGRYQKPLSPEPLRKCPACGIFREGQ